MSRQAGNAQRINDTAGMGLHMCLCSPWRSYATAGMTDTGSQRCEANELANSNITHALRKARVDAQARGHSPTGTRGGTLFRARVALSGRRRRRSEGESRALKRTGSRSRWPGLRASPASVRVRCRVSRDLSWATIVWVTMQSRLGGPTTRAQAATCVFPERGVSLRGLHTTRMPSFA